MLNLYRKCFEHHPPLLQMQRLAVGQAQVGAVATGGEDGRTPDLVVVFDVDADVASTRRANDGSRGSGNEADGDRMEQKGLAFQRRVRQGYLDQVKRDPDGYLLIDASVGVDEVFACLLSGLRERLG